MKKLDLKKLLDGIYDIHPTLIGFAGVYLLCLPVVSPTENSYMEDCAFVGGLVCVLYAGGMSVAKIIADCKACKAQSKKNYNPLTQNRQKFIELFKAKFMTK